MTENSWTDPGTGKTLHFDEEGNFVDDEGKGPQKGFKNDDKFGDWLHEYVQGQLELRGLQKMIIPDDNEQGTPIYLTPNALNNPENLLILICGSGRIHAGLWSVGVCAYRGLAAGSVLPCLDEAQKRNMEVIILNPNHPGSRLLRGEFKEQFGMILHSLYVFKNIIIERCQPKHAYIICHSMGGECTISAIEEFESWFRNTVVAVAMTDACTSRIKSRDLTKWCISRCINWVRSKQPLGTDLGVGDMCLEKSAETNDHPLTTFKAFPQIWEFFDQMASSANQQQNED
ncbi:hypothetical protein TRFO_01245 [Tritrichomonas foetus]|uniref:Arb2 domain-containing protein n=1 Tax=Tritrichomonas foetus TaxID=1144522 RepID=A0A1J4KBR8_9EUKA|nr:hypothetical protein TRFO_01245 [Tritrichomonas foetus]|eukprot:OHT07140.1 hypothetical protein TRFO_01245 [Tritrichomonas foetus]